MPVPVRKPPAPVLEGAPFGSLSQYSGGYTLPEGDYALAFNVVMHQGTNAAGKTFGEPRLGVMIDAFPLKGGEAVQQFVSLGSKAALSWAPHPETGKGVVKLENGAGQPLNNKTNWFLFLKSLYDCGLPEGIFVNDLTTIDGIHVHTALVPEPEDRKSFQSAQTGEAAQEDRKGGGLIPVVTEIKEDGKPWEGTGGFDFTVAAAPAPKPVAPKAGVKPPTAAKPAPVAKPRPVAAPVAVAEEAGGDEELAEATRAGITAVLEQPRNANGCTKLLLRTQAFSAISATAGAEVAQAAINGFFSDDDSLNGILGQLGYQVVGANVKPVA